MNKEYIEDRKIKIIDPSKVDINWYKYKIDQIFNKTMQFYRWLDSMDYLTKKKIDKLSWKSKLFILLWNISTSKCSRNINSNSVKKYKHKSKYYKFKF